MNRIEFMEELSGLLQDIPEEDRMDALNYYNDYFDDAGAENEKNVIDELESPEKSGCKDQGRQRGSGRWKSRNADGAGQ